MNVERFSTQNKCLYNNGSRVLQYRNRVNLDTITVEKIVLTFFFFCHYYEFSFVYQMKEPKAPAHRHRLVVGFHPPVVHFLLIFTKETKK